MSRLCTRSRRGQEGKVYHQCCKEISPDTSRCARNRSRANGGVINVFHLPGVGVEGDSSRDSDEPSFPLGFEKVVGEGWASFGGVSSSTGAGPNLLRLPNGAKHTSFCQTKCRNWHKHTVVGPRNFTSSWSPHDAQQRMSERNGKE
jgi:hypothetical protein